MKQTEIGLIPDDWEVKTLNGIGRFIGGGTPNTNNANYWKGNIPWISSSDISKDSINTLIPTRFITKEAVSCSATKLCPKNTILIVSRVGVGKLAISNTEVCTSQDFTNLVCDDNVDESFVAYQLLPKLQHKASEAQGTSIKGITTEEVRALQIPFPSYEEQQRIAKALSDVDTLISTTEKLIQKKKNIKQGAMQNLLTGKKRLPGFAKSTNYKQSELGLIPDDWDVMSLEEICKRITDGSHESPAEVENGYYMPSVKDMSIRGFDFSECKKISASDYQKLVQNGCKPEIGDVLIAKDGSILKYSFAIEEEMNIVILSSIAILKPNTSFIDSSFLALYFQQEDFIKSVIDNNKTGTGVPRIVLTNFKKINIVIPSKEEQTAIANVLSSMDKEIETLNTKLEKYRNLKTAMMQQLLTGKIRLV